MWVVSIGNPFDGLEIAGPFKSYESAEAWAENLYGLTWTIVKLNHPRKDYD